MLQEDQNRNTEVRKPFPIADRYKDDITPNELTTKKTEALEIFRRYLLDLKFIAENIEIIAKAKSQMTGLDNNSKEYKALENTIKKEREDINKQFDDFESAFPNTGYEKIGRGAKIADIIGTDVIGILGEKFNEEAVTNLVSLAREIKGEAFEFVHVERMKEISSTYLSTSADTIADIDPYNTVKTNIRSLKSNGDNDGVNKLIVETINANLPPVPGETFKMLERAALRLPSAEAMATIGFKSSPSALILENKYRDAFSINANNSLKGIPEEQHNKIRAIQKSLWNHEIPWTTPIQGESDIRLFETGYATYNRLGTLILSLKDSLESATNLNPEAKSKKINDTLRQFWKLYSETPALIRSELAESICKSYPQLLDPPSEKLDSLVATIMKADSQDDKGALLGRHIIKVLVEQNQIHVSNGLKATIRNNGNLDTYIMNYPYQKVLRTELYKQSVPYEDLSNALTTIKNNHASKTHSTPDQAYEDALKATSDSYDLIGNALHNLNLEPKVVIDTLTRYIDVNINHPEKNKISQYISDFKIRFNSLNVGR